MTDIQVNAENKLEYGEFANILQCEIYEIAALANAARALSWEIDEDANVYVTKTLRLIFSKLEALAAEVDDKCYDYELKSNRRNKVGG